MPSPACRTIPSRAAVCSRSRSAPSAPGTTPCATSWASDQRINENGAQGRRFHLRSWTGRQGLALSGRTTGRRRCSEPRILRRQTLRTGLSLLRLMRATLLAQYLGQVEPTGSKTRLALETLTQRLFGTLAVAIGVATVAQGEPGQRLLRPGFGGAAIRAPCRLGIAGLLEIVGGLHPYVHVGMYWQALRRQSQHHAATDSRPGLAEAGETVHEAARSRRTQNQRALTTVIANHDREMPLRVPVERQVL